MAEMTRDTTVLGSDTRFTGEMTFNTAARILGEFEGKITGKGELHVAESATCRATLDIGKIVIDGTVDGNITAHEKCELTSKARVTGDIIAARLTVADGASLTGHITVGSQVGKSDGELVDLPRALQNPPPSLTPPGVQPPHQPASNSVGARVKEVMRGENRPEQNRR